MTADEKEAESVHSDSSIEERKTSEDLPEFLEDAVEGSSAEDDQKSPNIVKVQYATSLICFVIIELGAPFLEEEQFSKIDLSDLTKRLNVFGDIELHKIFVKNQIMAAVAVGKNP